MVKAAITKEEFAQRIAALTLKGLSKAEVAEKLGITQRALNRYEKGDRGISQLLIHSLEYLESQYANSPDIGTKRRGRPFKLKE